MLYFIIKMLVLKSVNYQNPSKGSSVKFLYMHFYDKCNVPIIHFRNSQRGYLWRTYLSTIIMSTLANPKRRFSARGKRPLHAQSPHIRWHCKGTYNEWAQTNAFRKIVFIFLNLYYEIIIWKGHTCFFRRKVQDCTFI